MPGGAFQDSLCEGYEAAAQMIGGVIGPRIEFLDITGLIYKGASFRAIWFIMYDFQVIRIDNRKVSYCLEWSDQNFRKSKDQPTRGQWTFPGDGENWAYTKYFELTLILIGQYNYKHKIKRKKLICSINIVKVCYFSTDWLADWLVGYLTPCNRDLPEKLKVSELEEKITA